MVGEATNKIINNRIMVQLGPTFLVLTSAANFVMAWV